MINAHTEQEAISLLRDCDAVLVPAGTPVKLPKDTEVTITQALGGNFTVNIYGNLARIEAKDADALGKEVEDAAFLPPDTSGLSLEELIWHALKSCYDPEIPVNIVELGLIYDVDVEVLPEPKEQDKQYDVTIRMTLTAPGCGFGPMLVAEVEQKITSLPGVGNVDVILVFEPPWQQSMMSEQAKLQLNMF